MSVGGLRAEVLAIGDELTSGQRLDTNSPWLSQQLAQLGIRVLYHTTVGDDLQANVQVLRQAVERADVVVATGGLGPTADDLTRQALAAATGTELVLDEPSLAHIRRLFARRRRPMPQQNTVQALFPRGSRPIANPHGTAPGIAMEIPRPGRTAARLFALPGVPAEMHQMWQQSVEPALRQAGGGRRTIRHRRIKCFGVGESDLEQMLPDLIRRGRSPSVGITVSQATITLRVTAEGESPEACQAAMQPTLDTIQQCLGTLVFGQEDEELQDVVVRMLADNQRNLATVEWGSGGLLAHWLSEAAAASDVFLGGLVVNRPEMLTQLLDVPPELIARHGLASAEVARAMAAGCRRYHRSDYALALGPFPPADSPSTNAGHVHYGLASPNHTHSARSPFGGHPEILKPRSVKQALNLLRLKMGDG